MSRGIERPVLCGLMLADASLTRELAEIALQRAPIEVAAVILRSTRLSHRATHNRTAALLRYAAPGTPPPPPRTIASATPLELVALGRWHHRAGGLPDAEDYYIRALEMDERCEPAHRSYASLFEERAELRKARSAYLWATRVKETRSAWLGLARVESALGHLDALQLPIVRALRASASIGDLLEVGVASAALARPRLAMAAFAASSRFEPGDPALPYAAARIAESIDDVRATRRHADEALRRTKLIGDEIWVTREAAIGRSLPAH
jgi:tetratricopeptide (TPR) repeat protein